MTLLAICAMSEPPTPRRSRKSLLLKGAVFSVIVLGGIWWAGLLGIWPRHQAEQAIKSHRLDSAEQSIRQAIHIEGRTAENLFLLARVLRKQGAMDEFQSSLKQAYDLGIDRKRIEAELLLAQAQAGQIQPIQQQLDDLLIHGGTDDEEVLEAYVNGCLVAARLGQAETLIDGWVRAMPETAQPYYYRGRLMLFYRKMTQAREALTKALEIEPQHCAAAYALGTVLVEENRLDDALQMFQLASQTRYNAAARVQVAKTLVDLARSDEAREILKQVLQEPEDDVRRGFQRLGERYEGNPAALVLGDLCMNAGDYQQAYQWLQQAVAANPGDLTARHSLGLVLRGIGETEAAAAELKAVSEAREALQEVDRLVDLVSTNQELVAERVRVGELYLKYESKLTGEYWLKSALTRDPENQRAHELLAEYYAEKARTDPRYDEQARHHRTMAGVDGEPPRPPQSKAE